MNQFLITWGVATVFLFIVLSPLIIRMTKYYNITLSQIIWVYLYIAVLVALVYIIDVNREALIIIGLIPISLLIMTLRKKRENIHEELPTKNKNIISFVLIFFILVGIINKVRFNESPLWMLILLGLVLVVIFTKKRKS